LSFAFADTSAKEQESKDTKARKEGHGAFHMLPHYMKLYDVLKGAYNNYKVCQGFFCNNSRFNANMLKLLQFFCLVVAVLHYNYHLPC